MYGNIQYMDPMDFNMVPLGGTFVHMRQDNIKKNGNDLLTPVSWLDFLSTPKMYFWGLVNLKHQLLEFSEIHESWCTLESI